MPASNAANRVQAPNKKIVDLFIKDYDARHSTYGSNLQQFIDQRAGKTRKDSNCDPTNDDFRLAMEDFRDSTQYSKRTVSIEFDIGNALSWDDVLIVAKRAVKAYNESAKGIRGLPRLLGKITVEYGPAIQNVVQIIPNNQYTGLFTGALTFLMEAASILHEKQQEILGALSKIPDSVQDLQHERETFHEDKVLQDRIIQMFFVTLLAIDGMILYLTKKSSTKKLLDASTKDVYEQRLTDIINDIKGSYERASSRIDFLRGKTGEETRAGVGRLETNLSKQGSALTSAVNKSQEKIQNTISKEGQATRENFDSQFRSFLSEILRTAPWKPSQEAVQDALRAITSSGPRAAITGQELVQLLAIDPAASEIEIAFILNNGNAEELFSQSLLYSILREPRFCLWLSRKDSEVLFLQDNAGSIEHEPITVMSLLSADLSRNLREDHNALSIHFFCGHHTKSGNSLYGPVGMVRGLIQQLICTSGYSDFDLSFLNPRSLRNQLDAGDIRTLCMVFTKLVHQLLPDTMLFCFIDGISFFDRPIYQRDTFTAVNTLQALAQNRNLSSIFKLLITDLSQDGHRRYNIHPRDRLLLSRHIDYEGYDLTHREVMAQMRRKMIRNPNSSFGGQGGLSNSEDNETSDDDNDNGNEYWRGGFLEKD